MKTHNTNFAWLLVVSFVLLSLLLDNSAHGAKKARDDLLEKVNLARDMLKIPVDNAPQPSLIRENLPQQNADQTRTIAELKQVIAKAESAIKDLNAYIKELTDQEKKLEDEKKTLEAKTRELEKVQSLLTSGLIGAVVTAVVAVLGLFVNLRRSHAERDLKRLEVLEKVHELQLKGIKIPSTFLPAR